MTMHDRQATSQRPPGRVLAAAAWALACLALFGCQSPEAHKLEADGVAGKIIESHQREALGRTETFTIETPADALRRRLLVAQGLPISGPASLGTDRLKPVPHWPGKTTPVGAKAPLGPQAAGAGEERITLMKALQIAASNNRDYQTAKENVFIAALGLDLESQAFRNTYAGLVSGSITHDGSAGRPVSGVVISGAPSWSRRFKSGAALTGRIGLDLVQLLTPGRPRTMGLFADTSISVPLLRGAGRHIVTESLTQAQRDVIYAIYTLERAKRSLAVQVARDYLGVLQQQDEIGTARDNHERLVEAGKRMRARAKANMERPADVDLARQDELRASERVVRARNAYEGRLDALKITLGLPTDAKLSLDRGELQRMVDTGAAAAAAKADPTGKTTSSVAGKFELLPLDAIKLSLGHRLDLRTAKARVVDAQRGVVVAADGLKADLTLAGSAAMGSGRSVGSARARNAQLRPEEGVYSATVTGDLPWERTAERNAYRNSYIALERATRSVQELEDQIKLSVRAALRSLVRARETFDIQWAAVVLAKDRVRSTGMFHAAGRLEIRFVLEAQESLVSTRNALTAALVDYRVAELELQRDMGVLGVDEKGLWHEYRPEANE